MNTYTHIVRHYHPQPYHHPSHYRHHHHHSQLKSYEFDLISTIYLFITQIHEHSFGGELSDYPHPDADFQALLSILNNCNENAGKLLYCYYDHHHHSFLFIFLIHRLCYWYQCIISSSLYLY